MRMLIAEIIDCLLMLFNSGSLLILFINASEKVTITMAPDNILISLGQWISNFSVYQNHLKSFAKNGLMGLTSGVSGSLGPGQYS